MPVNPSAAAGAYATAARLVGSSAQAPQTGETGGLAGGVGGFADMVETAITNAIETGGAAEAKVTELASGNGDVVDLVTAVAETELAIQSMVTVRDRVISAYQDILNMPI